MCCSLSEAGEGVHVKEDRRSQICQRAMTENKRYGFEYRAAYDSEVRAELPLRPSASAAPPSGPRLFRSSLYAQEVFVFLCHGAMTLADARAHFRILIV